MVVGGGKLLIIRVKFPITNIPSSSCHIGILMYLYILIHSIQLELLIIDYTLNPFFGLLRTVLCIEASISS